MDIFAHGLYGAIVGKGVKKLQKKEPEKWTFKKMAPWIAWGMFPDAIAFLPTMLFGIITTGSLSRLSHHGAVGEHVSSFDLPLETYNFSHSLVIFLAVFFTVRLIIKKYPFVLLGWPLHILMDLPLHTKDFYPTPILFPLSDWRFQHGIHWSYPPVWFGLWILGIILFLWLSRKEKVLPTVVSSPETEKRV